MVHLAGRCVPALENASVILLVVKPLKLMQVNLELNGFDVIREYLLAQSLRLNCNS